MDLILWRHAQAVESSPDMDRPLTPKGHKDAATVAQWLRARLPKHTRILASPSVRTSQTAQALSLPFERLLELGPDYGVADHLAAAGWPDAMPGRHGAVVLVGHQPALGRLASLLISGTEADWTLKKGALWWLTNRVREGGSQTILKAVIGPDLL